MTHNTTTPLDGVSETKVDLREQLFNDGKIGLKEQVGLSPELITDLRGILFDIDLELFKASVLIPDPSLSPRDFFDRHVKTWLSRHPVLQKAEVRSSGSGLHVLLMLDEPLKLKDDLDRKRWAARVKIIQAILPTDPHQPGICGLTRPVGSINGKNGAAVAAVELLKAGKGVTEQELLDLTEEMVNASFATIFKTLFGRLRLDSCPVCQKKALKASDCIGNCYECGKVSLDKLMLAIQKEKSSAGKEVSDVQS